MFNRWVSTVALQGRQEQSYCIDDKISERVRDLLRIPQSVMEELTFKSKSDRTSRSMFSKMAQVAEVIGSSRIRQSLKFCSGLFLW